jgi:hypothetical protein
MLYRWLFGLRSVMDLKWRQIHPSDFPLGVDETEKRVHIGRVHVLNFHPKVDILRGVLEGFIAFVGYFLMLVVSSPVL